MSDLIGTEQLRGYRVPFHVVESQRARFVISNVGAERLPWVRVELAGAGMLLAASPGSLDVGESVELRYFGTEEQRSVASLVVSWMRPQEDGPYLWRWGM